MEQEIWLADIHYPDFEQQVASLIERDTHRMVELFSTGFVDTPCPVCLSKERTLQASHLGLHYHRCDHCGLLYVAPCPTEEIKQWYFEHSEGLKFWRENMPRHVRDSRNKLLYADRARFVADQMKRFGVNPGCLIEIGAGNGEMAEQMHVTAQFQRMILIEPQPLDISLPEVELARTTLENFRTDTTADVVIAFEVLEHVVDPAVFFSSVADFMSQNGILVFSTPNSEGLEVSVLGTLSAALRFDHIRLYSRRSLLTLLRRQGFEALDLQTPGELDVEIVHSAYEKGMIDLSSNPALRFLMEDGYHTRTTFQAFLKRNMLSSHMRCVARKTADRQPQR